MDEPTHLDLFSGIGGFSLAFEAAGFRTIGFSEINPYASAVLKKHWPHVTNYGDIRNIKGVSVHVISGGFPCQPFSLAGKRRGKEDDRHLWPEMLRVISEARPSWVLGENVPGIIGMELDNCLSDLEALGYACWPFTIPACAVDADHERKRVWIVAYSDGERKLQQERSFSEKRGWVGNGTQEAAPHVDRSRFQGRLQANADRANEGNIPAGNRFANLSSVLISRNYWNNQPVVGRRLHGIPRRLDRIRCLGNSIVPQVAHIFAKAIYQQLNERNR